MTLYEEFRAAARKYPGKVALETAARSYTYTTMLSEVDRQASEMTKMGVVKGDRIAVSAAQAFPVFTLELACSAVGATMAFLESFISPSSIEWEEAVASSSAHWSVTWLNRETPQWKRTEIEHSVAWPRPILLQARTSGTTGKSKGVCLSEDALLQAIRNTQVIGGVTSEARGLLIYEPLGLLSQIAAFSGLLAGSTMVDGIALADTPARIAQALEVERITHLVLVPHHIAAVINDPLLAQRDYSALHTIMYGAAPVTSELMRRARSHIRCRWLQCYGMTETTGPVCWLGSEEHELAGFSVGRPVEACSIRICDAESGEVLPEGATGEVEISGPLLMEGYWDAINQRPEPGNTIVKGWLRTGDLGAISADGYLFLRGRSSDEIVCALGYSIKPADIEGALIGLPEVLAVAAFGYEVGDAGVSPIVVCQVKGDFERVGRQIRKTLKDNLDRSKHPSHFVLVDHPLPHGSNGKIQKSRLKHQIGMADLVAV